MGFDLIRAFRQKPDESDSNPSVCHPSKMRFSSLLNCHPRDNDKNRRYQTDNSKLTDISPASKAIFQDFFIFFGDDELPHICAAAGWALGILVAR
jgi:hypothetical protein